MNSCPYCGSAMAARRKQCGADTCLRRYNADRTRKYNELYKDVHGVWPTAKYRTWYDRTCLGCGHGYKTTVKAGKYCSNTCQAAHEHGADRRSMPRSARRPKTRRERAEAKLAKAMAGTAGRQILVAGWCALCGKSAVTGRGMRLGDAFYCSQRCRRRQRDANRIDHELIDRGAIYARDRYRCHLCGKRVAMTRTAPHPQSPVLDHVIPRARGGETTAANLRLAHWRCNLLKSDRGGGEQLMLIG